MLEPSIVLVARCRPFRATVLIAKTAAPAADIQNGAQAYPF